MSNNAKQWVEVIAYEVSRATLYIGKVDAPLEKTILAADRNQFVRLESVRWLDEKKKKIIKYSDLNEGTEDTIYLRAGTILRISPIRKDKHKFWEKG